MRINKLLAMRGIKIPHGIHVGLHLQAEPLPEIAIGSNAGDDPRTVISDDRLQKLVNDLEPFKRRVIEIGICGIGFAEWILTPDQPRRERIANLHTQQLIAALRVVEHTLVHLGLAQDDLSGQPTARLMYEIEHNLRYRAGEDVHADSDAEKRVKAALLAAHVQALKSGPDDNTTIQ